MGLFVKTVSDSCFGREFQPTFDMWRLHTFEDAGFETEFNAPGKRIWS